MNEYNIDKAILQPTNHMHMYYPTRKTSEFHSEIIKKTSDKFIAFADKIISLSPS